MPEKPKATAVYDQLQFEPLLPTQNLDGLIDATRRVFERSAQLRAWQALKHGMRCARLSAR
jgi:hypothetical protein